MQSTKSHLTIKYNVSCNMRDKRIYLQLRKRSVENLYLGFTRVLGRLFYYFIVSRLEKSDLTTHTETQSAM